MASLQWEDHVDTGISDRHGKIIVQRGVTVRDLIVFRRRRQGVKNRYMYWADGCSCYNELLEHVVTEALRERKKAQR